MAEPTAGAGAGGGLRSGFVALAGRPNVGKSTLVNALVGDHVAAVTAVPQTTRRRALGVVHGDGYQLVLVDLPGFQKPFDRLTERMQRAVDESLADVDAVVLVLSAADGVGKGDRYIAGRVLRDGGPPALVAVNKVDVVPPARIAETIAAAAELGPFEALHPVSALTGDGLEALGADLAALLPAGPAYFPAGVTSDQPLADRVAEVVREQAMRLVREEVPHALAVEVEEIADEGRGPLTIDARLVCETSSQKGILVGRGGSMVRAIGTGARETLQASLRRPVHLHLTVKVRPRWRRDAAALERLGL